MSYGINQRSLKTNDECWRTGTGSMSINNFLTRPGEMMKRLVASRKLNKVAMLRSGSGKTQISMKINNKEYHDTHERKRRSNRCPRVIR